MVSNGSLRGGGTSMNLFGCEFKNGLQYDFLHILWTFSGPKLKSDLTLRTTLRCKRSFPLSGFGLKIIYYISRKVFFARARPLSLFSRWLGRLSVSNRLAAQVAIWGFKNNWLDASSNSPLLLLLFFSWVQSNFPVHITHCWDWCKKANN